MKRRAAAWQSRMIAALAMIGLFLHLTAAFASPTSPFPKARHDPRYVSDERCISCHARQGEDWRNSKHSRAMQSATAQSVQGDFQGQTLTDASGPTRFLQRAGQFLLQTRGADGQTAEFPVAYTLGVHPLQQYLIPQPGGRLQAFTLAWDSIRQRWFDLQADEPADPGSTLHWSGRYQNANLMCAECHTTGYRKGYDQKHDRYRTSWVAPNVGCQACHGPGKAHASTAGRGKKLPGYGLPLQANQVDQCAACHARRTRLREDTSSDGHFLDHYQPDNLRADLYYPDGQQLAEVFEYGSFRQSRMYQAGVVCSDCHAVHGGKLLGEGNALCTRCHSSTPNPAFPGLRARSYDDPAHHFHAVGTAGSQCVSCHMPARNYMVVHSRRDHAIRIPRPDLSVRLNTPNPCTECHTDQSAAWAAETIAARAGNPRYPRHYGEILAAARQGQPGALGELLSLVLDARQAGIVRATATELLAELAPGKLPESLLGDPDPAVRSTAAMAWGNRPEPAAASRLLPLLDDPVHAVRIAAARSLAGFPATAIPQEKRPRQHRALADFIAAQNAMADMPAAQLNLANLFAQGQQRERAREHYQRALRQDPAFMAGRLQFAEWLSGEHQPDEAEALLRAGLAIPAIAGESRLALSRMLARQGRIDEAREEYRQAVKLLKKRER